MHKAIILAVSPEELSMEFEFNNYHEVELVAVYSYTKITEGKHRKRFTDLQAGDVVTVKGTWNTQINVIYNTLSIKIRRHNADFPIS